MIVSILTDVTLWPPQYSKCAIFPDMEETYYVTRHSFLKEKGFVMFWWKGVPQQKTYKHGLCKPPNPLSIYRSVFLSIILSLYLFTYLTFYLLNWLNSSFYIPFYQDLFAHLGKKITGTTGLTGGVLSDCLSQLIYFLFPKNLVMTHLVFLHCLSL